MRSLILAAFMLLALSTISAQTKADPIAELRSPGATANQMLLADGSGAVVWGDPLDIISAGTGISINAAGVITNTSPEQIVTVTGTGRAVITGTHPNFNVNVPAEVDGSITNEKITAFAWNSAVGGTLRITEGGSNYDLALSTIISGTAGNAVVLDGGKLYVAASGYTPPTKFFYRNPSAINVGGTFTTTGTSLPATTTAMDVYVDGQYMMPRENVSDTDWDFERTGATQITFNRFVSAQSAITVIY